MHSHTERNYFFKVINEHGNDRFRAVTIIRSKSLLEAYKEVKTRYPTTAKIYAITEGEHDDYSSGKKKI
jgi:hypothetical protein